MRLNANLKDTLHDVEQKALVSLDSVVDYSLQNKIVDGKLYVDQASSPDAPVAGLKISAPRLISSRKIYRADEFTFSVYPASTPIYMELVKNGAVADLWRREPL